MAQGERVAAVAGVLPPGGPRPALRGRVMGRRRPTAEKGGASALAEPLSEALRLWRARQEGRAEGRAEAEQEPRLHTSVSRLQLAGDPEKFLETERGRIAHEAHNLAHRMFDLCEQLAGENEPYKPTEEDVSFAQEEVLRALRSYQSVRDHFIKEYSKRKARFDAGERDKSTALFYAHLVASWIGRISPKDRGLVDESKLAEAMQAQPPAGTPDKPGRAASKWRKLLEEAIKQTSFAMPAEQIRDTFRNRSRAKGT
jgi:hypothetical protein